MQPERAERLAELVEHAFELEGAERAAFLAQACGDDLELRAEVEALLREEERADRLDVRSRPSSLERSYCATKLPSGELSAGEMLG